LLLYLFDQKMASAAGRKIALHFRVPCLFFQLRKPICKPSPFGLRELFDCRFNHFYSHDPNMALLKSIGQYIPEEYLILFEFRPTPGPPPGAGRFQ